MNASQLKHQVVAAAVMALVLSGVKTSFGAERRTYGTEFANSTWQSRVVMKTSSTLLFPGAKLTDLTNVTFYAYQEKSSNCSNPGWAQSYFTHAYPAEGEPQTLVTTIQRRDGVVIKGVVIKLTQGANGVYGQQDSLPYWSRSTTEQADADIPTWDAAQFDGSGNIVPKDSRTGTGDYKFSFVHTRAPVPTAAPQLVFANGAGEPTLTLDDLRNCRFAGWLQGSELSSNFRRVGARNRVLTEENDHVTKMRLEFQACDGAAAALKCAVVELTNGEDGVYAQVVKAGTVSSSQTPGHQFVAADGSWTAGVTDLVVTSALGGSGLGLAGLTAFCEGSRTHYGSDYTYGTFQAQTDVPSAWTFVFPEATLAELRYATLQSYVKTKTGSISATGMAQSYVIHAYPDWECPEFLVAGVQKVDGQYVKATVVKLTETINGVYAQELCTPYYKTQDSTHEFIKTISATGGITYDGTTDMSYAFNYLNTRTIVPTAAPRLLFSNGAGEPTLTLDDIRNCTFTGYLVGGACVTDAAKFSSMIGQNAVYEQDAQGNLAKIRIEMQSESGGFLKCVAVELTNGEGGVYGQSVRACYANQGIGYRMLTDEGELQQGVESFSVVAVCDDRGTILANWGYGLAGLVATLTERKQLTLDRSMTWSELTGSAESVQDTERIFELDVTADATLTFDVPVQANTLLVRSAVGNSPAFAVADGVEAPVFAQWDLRETTGNVVFSGFTPVTNARTDNILPNAASTLFFNGPTNGKLPFNETGMEVPCKEVALGDGVALNAFVFNRVRAFTVTGEVTLNGNVTGTGTIALTADGSIGIAPGVTLANTVTLSVPDGVKTPLRLLGDGGWTKLPFATAAVTGGGAFVLRQGTLKCAYGDPLETAVEIGEGGVLEIAVRDYHVHEGYVSPAVLGAGGVIRFVGPDGQEVGVGRAEMNVLPGAPGADVVWTPTDDGPNTLSTDANWSSGTTPGEGDVVLTDGGRDGGATVTLAAAQTFGVIIVKEGASIAFTADGGAVSGQRIVVGPNASVTLPTAAVSFEELEVMPGATVVFADAGEPMQVASLTVNGQLDLRGTTLSAASFGGTGTVTDTREPSADGRTGELHLTVATGSQTLALMLSGSVKVVKEGAGTLVLGKMTRTNGGGWEIAAGTVKPSDNLNTSRAFGQLGSTIVVHDGATYDMNDQRDSRVYRFVLNGGTIANFGASGIPSSGGSIGEITLTTNSFLNAYSSFPLWGTVDLNGYELTVDIRSSRNLYLYKDGDTVGGIFTNGTVNIRSGGYFRPDAVAGNLRDMRTVDFVLGAALDMQTSINVRNLAAGWKLEHTGGGGKVNIYGVFTPNAENYLSNFELQDGATLNLKDWNWKDDGIYDISKSVTGQTLGFAEGATVYVSLGSRKVSQVERVVAWDAGKKPNVKFRPAPGTSCGFVAKVDGLYAVKGLRIVIR